MTITTRVAAPMRSDHFLAVWEARAFPPPRCVLHGIGKTSVGTAASVGLLGRGGEARGEKSLQGGRGGGGRGGGSGGGRGWR